MPSKILMYGIAAACFAYAAVGALTLTGQLDNNDQEISTTVSLGFLALGPFGIAAIVYAHKRTKPKKESIGISKKGFQVQE